MNPLEIYARELISYNNLSNEQIELIMLIASKYLETDNEELDNYEVMVAKDTMLSVIGV
jgi:aspartate carbamoyltransferase catalytic subunit